MPSCRLYGLVLGLALPLAVSGCDRRETAGSTETTAPAFDSPTAPPSETGSSVTIEQAAATLKAAGNDPSALLGDPTYLPLHPDPAFRELIREHARAAPLTIVTPDEPGLRIVARGLIRSANGKPLPDVLVYVYQTDDRGWYAADAPHVSGMAGDQRHARLFGYVRTSSDGTFEIHTIRPVGYPQTELWAHIHVEVFRDDEELLVTELLFEDDPRLTAAAREQSLRHGFMIAPPAPGPDGTTLYAAEFTCE